MTTAIKHSKHLVVELEDKAKKFSRKQGGSDVREDGGVGSARNPSCHLDNNCTGRRYLVIILEYRKSI